ncbi:MAG: PepSY domain-containing protein, partial [Clostridiales bacterium]|nr:PepSY domain-containing protein [Clostridiales bacterium]
VYDIEFYTSAKEYEYEINAATGAILDKDVETRKTSNGSSNTGSTSSSGNTSSDIGIDKAKSIAANHAGYSVSDVTFSKVKLDEDDGVAVYEIEFYKGNRECEYEINAATGSILDYDSEVDDD